MKIVSSGQGVHSSEFHQKKKREKQIKAFVALLLAIVFIGVPVYLLRLEQFSVSNIKIEGNSVTKSEDIEQIVSNILSQNYLWFIPKSNALLYPKNRIISDLMNQIPRLGGVEISLSNPRSMNIVVVERQPFALYCTDFTNPNTPTGCFFLDKDGYVFSEAPSFSGGVYFVYTSDPAFSTPLRLTYLNKQKFNELSDFIKSLADIGLYPKVFVNKGDEYNLVLSNGALVMWKSIQDLNTVRSNLESFISNPNFLKEKNALGRILYIDLRFGNKVFYKFRD